MKTKTPVKIEEVKLFAENISTYRDIANVNIIYMSYALRVLTEAKDKTSFRKICDSYARLEKAPLAKLEWIYIALDHSFSIIGYLAMKVKAGIETERLPILGIQKFFQDQYGSHFYLD